MRRIFVLSPARANGERARLLLHKGGQSLIAQRLHRGEAVPLGEIFRFLSGLYFRGKLAYGHAFANPPPGMSGIFVITPNRGLVDVEALFTLPELRALGENDIDPREPLYREPLTREAGKIARKCGRRCEVVLLGSIATGKYVDVLLEAFDHRLKFPEAFIGRGDMSRGGLLLRCAADGQELTYIPVRGAIRHGKRPEKLPPRRYAKEF